MELKTFVTETLVNIVNGVRDAQIQLNETGSVINAGVEYASYDGPLAQIKENFSLPRPQLVEFDIALTVIDSDQVQSGVKAGILNVISSSAQTKTNTSESAVNRVRFSIPVVFPWHK